MQDAVSTCRATIGIVVRSACVTEQAAFVHATLREVDRARADARIFRATDRLSRFFSGIDVGDQYSVSAEIESLLNARPVVISAHPHHRLGTAARDAAQHGGKFFVIHGTMLGIDEQPVIAAMGKLFCHGRAVRVQKQAHLGLAFAQLFLELSASQRFRHRDDPPEIDESDLV